MFALFGSAYAAPYAASKGALVQLTKSLATAWAADNIQVNVVLPGWIDTELTRDARQQVAGLHKRVLGRTPAGRWGVAEDLAGVAVFLASPASDFITGAAIPVDGGFSGARVALISPALRAGSPLSRGSGEELRLRTGRIATDICLGVTAEVLDARRVVTVAAWTYFPMIRGFRRSHFRE